ncbi:hypothetical protein HDV04_006013 [Boothiomyces sp. JEL0838]|nr:hypothetical protein HDV04_006013 [Boothiomyces sp. JEL0838]
MNSIYVSVDKRHYSLPNDLPRPIVDAPAPINQIAASAEPVDLDEIRLDMPASDEPLIQQVDETMFEKSLLRQEQESQQAKLLANALSDATRLS